MPVRLSKLYSCGKRETHSKIPRVNRARHAQEKEAWWIARAYGERQRYFSGQHMWARGYFVSTVGLDEEVIREYIKNQENDDRRQDELFD